MRTVRLLVPAALSLLAGLLLGLAPAPARADTKIGYVDMQRALNEVDEGKTARAALKKEFDAKQKLLDEKKQEFEKLRADFEKQATVMSEDARKQKQGDLEKKGQELQGFFMQQQKELSDREREATRGIFEKMTGVVREIADAEGVGIVLQAEAVVSGAPSLDLTNELVRKYNARYKAAAPAAAASPAPAADKKPAPAKKDAAK
jgi:outer membrane protein